MTNDEGRTAARLELKTLSEVGELLEKLGDAAAIERVLRYHAERQELTIIRIGTFPMSVVDSVTPIANPLLEQVKRIADALEALPQSEHGELAVCVTGHVTTTASNE